MSSASNTRCLLGERCRLTGQLRCPQIPFDMDTKSKVVREACVDMLKGGQRQMRHRLKKKYFDGVPANLVRTTSPVTCMTNDQWGALVEMWSNLKHKATMETIEAEPMQEGQQSMSSIEILSKVLPKLSTFLQNVGLSTSKPSIEVQLVQVVGATGLT